VIRDRKVRFAAMVIAHGFPLPLDLSVYLVGLGYDLAAFEMRFTP
jgi:hypothetical protein